VTENANTPVPEPEGQAGEQAREQAGQVPQAAEAPETAGTAGGTTAGTTAGTTGATAADPDHPWAAAPDDEEGLGYGEPAEPDGPNTGVAATFLPGIEAASILALLTALLGAGVYLLVYPLVQAHGAARTWSDFKNNVPRGRQDPFGTERDWIQYQSWGHIILGLVAILLALFVLGLWTAHRNRLYSRAFAQAALVLGLAVVLYGILLKTGAVGSEIPSMKEIGGALSSQQ
jgi:hypothetical protein